MKRFVQFYAKDYGSEKMKEGAVSRISRVKSFLHYMSKGKGRLHEWAFLYDVARIKEWVQDLRTSGKQITTVRYYIHHVAQFLDYMLTTRPPHTRLTVEQNREILRRTGEVREEDAGPVPNVRVHDRVLGLPHRTQAQRLHKYEGEGAGRLREGDDERGSPHQAVRAQDERAIRRGQPGADCRRTTLAEAAAGAEVKTALQEQIRPVHDGQEQLQKHHKVPKAGLEPDGPEGRNQLPSDQDGPRRQRENTSSGGGEEESVDVDVP
ncbi:uncharacterized protein LOC108228920 isoform X2 [Kryptolebias marmoratus]|uniref:uncharacterized protein LOC108228920 isoform X2 n=1 Tax=Kryptolebias marmoratus TaxID=37003 RepID=UPI0018ACEF3C|nr:uncharacterized protein LOC108228920 isoform X2 [Kryptolebias marmoratus]